MSCSHVGPPAHFNLSLISWTGVVVVDIENSDDFFYENRELPPIPLIVNVGANEEYLTWNVRIKPSHGDKLSFLFEFVDGPLEIENCRASIEVSKPGGVVLAKMLCKSTEIKRKNVYKFGTISEADWRKYKNDISEGAHRITIELTILRESRLEKGSSWAFQGSKLLGREEKSETDRWLSNLYDNPIYSDVIIKCGGKIFRAHKIVLARYPVFAQLLEAQTVDPETEILIEDMTPNSLNRLLKCIYKVGSPVPNEENQILELLECSAKYKIPELETLCIQKLVTITTDENIAEINIAVQKCCTNPKALAIFKNYCRQNHARLSQNEDYQKLYLENLKLF
ncbi:unnamed protein product [Allacma fusca]|uniref:BTB domain-containing protein n=1 Tax=Allacma fusca TaxID=39272 RepID=A0A8J2LVD9_9HEXA|nr:unnamed protein product [Allacma fusca]CAG7837292.1 unnamed protein product [Allacma fusca]